MFLFSPLFLTLVVVVKLTPFAVNTLMVLNKVIAMCLGLYKLYIYIYIWIVILLIVIKTSIVRMPKLTICICMCPS